ncbi:MAG: hypothetical protein IT288_00610 [Bdellovibrionales bacterium]|nr:hypothetical protein [Bdellovibrionales bacterium]
MNSKTLALALLIGFSFSATAAGPYRPITKKVLDGTVLFCPTADEDQRNSLLQVQMRVVDAIALTDVVQIDLMVRSVQCQQQRWIVNPNVRQNGTSMMSDYELIVVDAGSKILYQSKLDQFEKSGEQIVTVGLERNLAERLGQVEVFVRAKQTRTTRFSGQDSFFTSFGSYNLLLK